jgi:hypothetical protein
MSRVLAKRWLWCQAVIVAVLSCLLPLLWRYADPYHGVQSGMTYAEVRVLLGPASQGWTEFVSPGTSRNAITVEVRDRFWDVVTVTYAHCQTVGITKTRRPLADVWQDVLYKVGWKTPPTPAPAAPLPVAPPRPLLPLEERPQAHDERWIAGACQLLA